MPGIAGILNSDDSHAYGFGFATSADGLQKFPIGAYLLVIDQQNNGYTGDGKNIQLLSSIDNGLTWKNAGVGVTSPKEIYTFGDQSTANSNPPPRGGYTNISGPITIVAGFNKGSALPTQTKITLDGSVTFQLLYQ